jgi:hypothetical protein
MVAILLRLIGLPGKILNIILRESFEVTKVHEAEKIQSLMLSVEELILMQKYLTISHFFPGG